MYRVLTRRRLDVFDLLELDHVKVELLFKRWKFSSNHQEKQALLISIQERLSTCTEVEEKVFYPVCETIPSLRKWLSQSYQQNEIIRKRVASLQDIAQRDLNPQEEVQILIKEVGEHLRHDENELFPRLRATLKKADLETLTVEVRLARRRSRTKLAA